MQFEIPGMEKAYQQKFAGSTNFFGLLTVQFLHGGVNYGKLQ